MGRKGVAGRRAWCGKYRPGGGGETLRSKVMTRRSMLSTTAAGAFSTASAQEAPKNGFFELRYYRMRNARSNQVQRTTEFLSKAYAPAARRAGIQPVGIFNAVIAPEAPFLLVASGYPSLAAMQASMDKLAADGEYQKALAAYTANPELAYVRMESTLFRCFDAVPAIETGPATEGRNSRTFELRTYESDNEATLRRKVKMFNDGEVAAFRKNGLQPVFFGEALIGPNLPRLTYMVAYENLAAHDKVWGAFSADPDWQKLRAQPGLADAEVVSNISNAVLRPAAGSDIR
jgi:hypothetical protein